MRIAVCDDEAKERERFLQALGTWNRDLKAECFPSGASLLEAAKTPPPFDIVFDDARQVHARPAHPEHLRRGS